MLAALPGVLDPAEDVPSAPVMARLRVLAPCLPELPWWARNRSRSSSSLRWCRANTVPGLTSSSPSSSHGSPRALGNCNYYYYYYYCHTQPQHFRLMVISFTVIFVSIPGTNNKHVLESLYLVNSSQVRFAVFNRKLTQLLKAIKSLQTI